MERDGGHGRPESGRQRQLLASRAHGLYVGRHATVTGGILRVRAPGSAEVLAGICTCRQVLTNTHLGRLRDNVTATMTTITNSWRDQAACRGLDPDIFYPVSDDDADMAKAVCATCPVREACLEHALANRERDGIWGGASERERRRMVRQRRKSA